MKSTFFSIGLSIMISLFCNACSKSKEVTSEPKESPVKEKVVEQESQFKVEDSNYDHTATVKDMAFLWKIEDQNLQIKLVAKTSGWLGIGFNPEADQAMKGANFLIGSVKNGKAEIEDHYGTMKTSHKLDEKLGGKSDISDVAGKENGGMTEISFTIPLNSSDTNDKAIDPGKESIVLLAYGKSDVLIMKHTFHATLKVNLTTGAFEVVSSE